MAYASEHETGVAMTEAWQRVSSTLLRKKIVKTWDREYTGVDGEASANTLLETVISTYSNVYDGTAQHVGGGMWTVKISFKEANWVVPAQYKAG